MVVMGYKGHPGWSDADVGNVPPANPSVECAEPTCETTTSAKDLPGEWQATPHPEEVVLCPSCKQEVPDKRTTPSEHRENVNADLSRWSAEQDEQGDRLLPDGGAERSGSYQCDIHGEQPTTGPAGGCPECFREAVEYDLSGYRTRGSW